MVLEDNDDDNDERSGEESVAWLRKHHFLEIYYDEWNFCNLYVMYTYSYLTMAKKNKEKEKSKKKETLCSQNHLFGFLPQKILQNFGKKNLSAKFLLLKGTT